VLLWLSVPPFPLCFPPPFPPFPPFPPYSETTLSSLTAPGTVNLEKQFYLLFHDLSIILEHCNGPCSVHLRLTCSPFVLSASIVLHSISLSAAPVMRKSCEVFWSKTRKMSGWKRRREGSRRTYFQAICLRDGQRNRHCLVYKRMMRLYVCKDYPSGGPAPVEALRLTGSGSWTFAAINWHSGKTVSTAAASGRMHNCASLGSQTR
jgi:hypothetical protein